MASATSAADGGALQLDSIPIVDLRLLSQSELYSLSLCSSSAFDPSRWDDVVIPKIDRSVFNESAGSRKQTYSRLRLAPPSSSSSAAPRRRTPHLRPATASFAGINNNNSDPENAENAQIVTLLKQLFVTDINPEELVPVKIDYSQSLPAQQFSSLPASAPSNVGHTGQKRKRGRPRKNEHKEIKQESVMDVSVVDVDDADGFSLLNEIVVRENVEDKDREVLNTDGVAVDLMALGTVEHPYREEIRSRTEGLGTEEELLEFLKRLNGQWGSRRKKKRIVDASEFGNALPIGWKLSLSVKKKNGHVWLCCRRYISPGGLHFISCKGVSSYLLSLHGVHLTNTHSSMQYDEIVNDADKLASATIADQRQPDLGIKDDNSKENFHASLPAFGSTMGNNEMQVLTNAGVSLEERAGEIFHCNKCNVTFSGKDELLQHQSSIHRRNRYKRGMRVTDGVIIKDGKYECQFCHKTFNERRQYTGHIGAHIRYEGKAAAESPAGFVNPGSAGEFPVQATMTEGSLKSDNDLAICDANTNNRLNICSPCNKDNKHARDLNEDNGNMRFVDEAMETNLCSVAEAVLPSNENRSVHEDTCEYGSAAEIIDDGSNMQGRRAGSCSQLPPNDATDGVMDSGLIENSASIQNPEQSMASITKSSLLDSSNHVEECKGVVNNELNCWTRNELKLDCQNFAVNGSVFNSSGNHGNQDKDLAVIVKQQSDLKCLPCKNFGATDNTSTSGSVASKNQEDPNLRPPTSHSDKACLQDDFPSWIGKRKVDDKCGFGIRENDGSKADNDGLSRHQEMQSGIGSVFPSWNEQQNASKKSDNQALNCLFKEPEMQNASNSKLVALSGLHGSENNNDAVCRREIEEPEFDGFQNFGNGESRNPFNDSDAGLNPSFMTRSQKDRKLGVCSPFSTATDKQFLMEDSMIRMFNDALEEQKQQPSGGIVLGQSGVPDFSNKEYTTNKIYSSSANPPKLNENGNTGRHGLSLSFDNLQTELCTDSNTIARDRFEADSFNIQSAHKTYCDQTNLSIGNTNIPSDQKRGRSFGIDFRDSSFNSRAQELGSSFNLAQPGTDWNEPTGQKIDPSCQNFMAGFGSSSSLSDGCVTADGPLRAGNENVFRGAFDVASVPQVPSSSCFSSFGLTSDKGGEGSFGVDKDYGICADMLTQGRTEPVEYSFMGEQTSNSLPRESKIFSYGANIEQGLDPLFWLGKDASASQTTNQVASLCVWCRNVFFQEQVQAGIQTGAIGTMCPSCSSRIPGQFDVL